MKTHMEETDLNNTIDFDKVFQSIEKAKKIEEEEQKKKDNINKLMKKAQSKRG